MWLAFGYLEICSISVGLVTLTRLVVGKIFGEEYDDKFDFQATYAKMENGHDYAQRKAVFLSADYSFELHKRATINFEATTILSQSKYSQPQLFNATFHSNSVHTFTARISTNLCQ